MVLNTLSNDTTTTDIYTLSLHDAPSDLDNQAPVIVCPADITQNTDTNACGAIVSYTAPVGTDSCPGSSTAQTAGLASGSLFPLGVTTNQFVVSDAAGNTAACSFTVTVLDNQAPVIVCPADIIHLPDALAICAIVNFTAPLGTDSCPGSSTAQTAGLASGSLFPLGVTTNTFVVSDAAGNTAACSFTVTVLDNQAPVIVCPADITQNTDTNACGAIVNFTAPVGTDSCPGWSTAQTAGLASGSLFPLGVTTNTFLVSDAAGNTAACSFMVFVLVNQAPVIVCPADITQNTDTNACGAIVSYTAPVGTDSCPGSSTAQTAGLASGSLFPLGVTTNQFVVSDAAGNTAACSFTVTVLDNQAPVIVCPADIIHLPDALAICAIVNFTAPLGTDSCPGSSTAQTAGLASGSLFPLGVTTNTFVVSDAAGNTAACSFTVTVLDNQAPVIVCPADITQNTDTNACGASVSYTAPVGTDSCPGSSTAQTAGLASGSLFPLGVTTNTFVVSAAAGNTAACSFTVTVLDNQAPVIVCPADITQNTDTTACAAIVTLSLPVALPICPGSSTAQTAGLASGSLFPLGVTTNTFVVSAAAGNTATFSLHVALPIYQAPVIVCPADITQNTDTNACGAIVNFTAPVGTDSCPGSSTVQTAGLASGSLFPLGVTTNTFVVSDAADSTGGCNFTVTDLGNQATVIVCPRDITQHTDTNSCGAIVSYTAPVGTDSCPGSSTAQTAGLASGSLFPLGVTTNTFVVSDAAGNTAACSFTVTVLDNQAPVIVCPADITQNTDTNACGAIVSYTAPVGTDGCPGSSTVQTAGLASGSLFPLGVTTNTFVVSDAAGNTAACSFTVTVLDNQPPSFPTRRSSDLNTDTNACGAIVSYTAPVGTDSCPGSSTAQTAGLASGSLFPLGVTTKDREIVVEGGSAAACSLPVTVLDKQAPVIVCPAEMTQK